MTDNDIRYKLAVDCLNSAAELVRFSAVLLSGTDLDAVDKTQLCNMLCDTAAFCGFGQNSEVAK